MAAILDVRSPGSKAKSLHWHALWNDFTAPSPETVYKAAQLTKIVKIVFKQAMAAILDNKGMWIIWHSNHHK